MGVKRHGRREFLKAGGALAAATAMAPMVQAASGKDTIKIGASLPFTGPDFFVEDGMRQFLAYRQWQEEVNRAGGLLGNEVKLVIHDDGASPERAADVYRRLIAGGAQFLLGNYSSSVAAATIRVVEDAAVPCVFPMAWQPQLWLRDHRWTAPLLPLATRVTQPLVEYLHGTGVRRVAAVNAENAYARDLAEGFVRWVREYDMNLVAHETFAFDNRSELKEALGKAARSEPDVLAGGSVGDQVPELARIAREAGPDVSNHAWFELDEPVILAEREIVEGMIGFGLWTPNMPYPGNREFVRRFMARWQPEYPDIPMALLIDHHAAAGYGAAQILQAAVAEAETLDRARVRDALFSLDTSSVFGHYRLDKDGIQVGKEVPVVGYRKGLREVLFPDSLATV